jgi:hypothetical protein
MLPYTLAEAFGWRYLKATRGASMMEGPHSPARTLLSARKVVVTLPVDDENGDPVAEADA